MPSLKLPAGNPPAGPANTPVMAVPPIAPAPPTPAAPAGLRAPVASAPAASSLNLFLQTNRAPMVTGSMTKKSAIVERALQTMAARLAEQTGLQEGSPELAALLKLSAEVVERVVWEVVPVLAEQIIRENLQDLASKRTA